MRELKRFTVLFLILAMAACGGGDGAPPAEETQQSPAEAAPAADAALDMDLPEGVTAAMVAEGETVYNGAGICFTCHMAGGVGGPLGPNLTDDEWLNIEGSYESIVQNIMTGVLEPKEFPGLMPPKGGSPITDEQVAAVAAYVWTLSQGG